MTLAADRPEGKKLSSNVLLPEYELFSELE